MFVEWFGGGLLLMAKWLLTKKQIQYVIVCCVFLYVCECVYAYRSTDSERLWDCGLWEFSGSHLLLLYFRLYFNSCALFHKLLIILLISFCFLVFSSVILNSDFLPFPSSPIFCLDNLKGCTGCFADQLCLCVSYDWLDRHIDSALIAGFCRTFVITPFVLHIIVSFPSFPVARCLSFVIFVSHIHSYIYIMYTPALPDVYAICVFLIYILKFLHYKNSETYTLICCRRVGWPSSVS